jgi:hypothetical protein
VNVHSFHDDILEAGLEDECLRCHDLAMFPEQLDAENRARIQRGHLYTHLDRVAATNLELAESRGRGR